MLISDRHDPVAPVQAALNAYGFATEQAFASEQALPSTLPPADLALLMLERSPGLAPHLIGELRTRHGDPAIIVRAPTGDEADHVIALEMGADDYIRTDCHDRELIARIRAVLRRLRPQPLQQVALADLPSSATRIGSWTFDQARRMLVSDSGHSEILGNAEFLVLQTLAAHAGRVVTRETLMAATRIDGTEETRSPRAIDIHVSRLRSRLASSGEEIIRTVRRNGYLLLAPQSAG